MDEQDLELLLKTLNDYNTLQFHLNVVSTGSALVSIYIPGQIDKTQFVLTDRELGLVKDTIQQVFKAKLNVLLAEIQSLASQASPYQ